MLLFSILSEIDATSFRNSPVHEDTNMSSSGDNIPGTWNRIIHDKETSSRAKMPGWWERAAWHRVCWYGREGGGTATGTGAGTATGALLPEGAVVMDTVRMAPTSA